jgi:CHASE3 domain sensor protein
MPEHRWFIPIIVGVVFILLGLGAVLWGRREERKYYDSLTTRADLREFVEHWPRRPEPGASKIGGWIAVAIGLMLVIIGGIYWLVS